MSKTLALPVHIRPAHLGDADSIAVTHVTSWKHTYPGLVPQEYIDSLDVKNYRAIWQTRLAENSSMVVQVAEQGGAITGFASAGPAREALRGFNAELYAIYLLPDSQSNGIGSKLLWSIMRQLVLRGYDDMFVWVLAHNPSRGFYEHLGGLLLLEANRIVGGRPIVHFAYGWKGISHLAADFTG